MWKKFLITILICLTFLFLLEQVGDFFMKKNPRMKISYITQFDQKADILILGSCEAAMMLDPSLFYGKTGYKTYNLGEQGARFADNYLYLYQYLKYQKHPKYLILQASPESFYSVDNKLLTTYKHEAFLSDSVVSKVIEEIDPDYFRFSKIPYLKYSYYNVYSFSKILSALGFSILNIKHPEYRNGFDPPPLFNSDTSEISEFRITTLYGYKWNSIEEKYFRKILALCNENGIQVVVYKSPYYKSYYNLNLGLKKYDAQIEQIAAQYKAPFFTYDTSALTLGINNYYKIVNSLFTRSAIPLFDELLINDLKDSVFVSDFKK